MRLCSLCRLHPRISALARGQWKAPGGARRHPPGADLYSLGYRYEILWQSTAGSGALSYCSCGSQHAPIPFNHLGTDSSNAEVEAELLDLWSSVEKENAAIREQRGDGNERDILHLQHEPAVEVSQGLSTDAISTFESHLIVDHF